MARLLISFVALAAAAAPSLAQSINVDMQPSGGPFGVPSPSYGGSAGSPGTWNPVSAASVTNLLATDGSPTGVSLMTTASVNNFFSNNFASTSGDDEALLDDFQQPDDGWIEWVFTGLAPGHYRVDTIIVDVGNALWLEVTVPGSPDTTQNIWGNWSGSYAQGTNYARHGKIVTDGELRVQIQQIGLPDYIYVNGIQLVKDDIGTLQCFGDGIASSCPCGNDGLPNRGCQNSAATGGAFLYSTGTTVPDTAILLASGELPTALSIFLQGNATISPVPFGDGLRCAGGILKRLYVKSATSGAVSAPAAGDPSISAQSANLGDPIPAGERRYYQVYYRDSDIVFCPSPTGSTFNVTNVVKLTW